MKMATGEGNVVSFASSGELARKIKQLKVEKHKNIYETDYIIPGFVDIHNHGLGGTDDILDYWTNPGFPLENYMILVLLVFSDNNFSDPPKLDRSLKGKVLSLVSKKQ